MTAMRRTMLFDGEWKFYKGEAFGAEDPGFDDSSWRAVRLPHDWSIEGPFDEQNASGTRGGFLPGGEGWYRKRFTLDPTDTGKQLFLLFDGIYHNSEIWINGHYLGKRPYGYVSFEYEITDYISLGASNTVSVHVDNSDQPNCRWYTGSGIYRHVWLTAVDPLYVERWGTYVTTPDITPTSAIVDVKTRVHNGYAHPAACELETLIVDRDGTVVGRSAASRTLAAGESAEFVHTLTVSSPQLWSLETPALYEASSRINVEGRTVDTYVTPFGIRHIRFDAEQGFMLNGRSLKLKGVNLHHDAGGLGAAVPERVWERRLEILKEMGCNAIRCSHNPPAPELLDLCDRMGFLVIDEAFDKWHSGSYGAIFDVWWERDLASMLLRDRNHPSIIMWSVGNEVEHQGSEPMLQTLKMLVDYVHRQEPTRPVTYALHPFKDGLDRIKTVTEIGKYTDVLGCNYQEQWYDLFKEDDPGLVIVGTETYPFFRGSRTSYKGFEPVNPWFDVEKHDYVAGGFLWSGIDYLGESPKWPSKGWAGGVINTCGFRKPSSYFFESVWTDRPMVHIAVYDDTDRGNLEKLHWNWPRIVSHWTFPHYEDDMVRLVTFTNCETVELSVNGQSAGVKRRADFPDGMMIWYVPYTAGKIRAVGRTRDEELCMHELQTAGAPSRLSVTCDRMELRADGRDAAHVEVRVTDEQGVTVPYADHPITFELSGEGRLIAVDNGDLDSSEPYQGPQRKAYRGRCLAVIQSDAEPGEIKVSVSSPGLTGAETILHIKSGS